MDKVNDIVVGRLRAGFDHVVISYMNRVTKEQIYRCVDKDDIVNLPAFVRADRRLTAEQRMRRQTLRIKNFDPFFDLKHGNPPITCVRGARIYARVEKGKKSYFKRAI